MEKIVIVGGGGHAKSVINVIRKTLKYRIVGYVDVKDQGMILESQYLGSDQRLPHLLKKYPRCSAILGVGYVKISKKRKELKEKLTALGFKLPVIVSPTAVINEHVTIGQGTIVHDNVVINTDTTIGEYAIINNASCIDHDCKIGNFVHVAPGATLSGEVVVGDYSILGVGSTVIQHKVIGRNCFIGAGSTVINDCLKPGLYVGVPAIRRE